MTLAICTTTLYRLSRADEAVRWECAREFLKRCANKDIKVFVVDGGSSPDVIRGLAAPNVHFFRQRGMTLGMARRQAVLEAYKSGLPVILYTELEKHPLVTSIDELLKCFNSGTEQLVIPERESLDSYPLEQQAAERAGNSFFAQLTGMETDLWFGPRIWSRKLSSYFLEYCGEYGDNWESIFVPVARAMKAGVNIHGMPIPYQHPSAQTAQEAGNAQYVHKRGKQLNVISEALRRTWLEPVIAHSEQASI